MPYVWKTSGIIPVPKNYPREFNDLRPVALTSVKMKCLEHITKRDICKTLDPQGGKLQFAYSQNMNGSDAELISHVCEHLESRNSQVRILYRFQQCSTLFNRMYYLENC